MRLRRISLLALAGVVAALGSATLVSAEPERERDQPAGFPWDVRNESRLDMAREEAGALTRPPRRFDLPAGELRVTPAETVAGLSGQKLRFTVVLDRGVPDASLHVTLPARWVAVPASGLPAVRGPAGGPRAGGRARLRRSARDVTLTFDDAAPASTAGFEVVDNGIPAGTYRLPFRWVDGATGQTRRAGTARVVLYAPAREATGRALPSPGAAANVTNDTLEESETFVATTLGDASRILVGVNWSQASMAGWITTNGGQSWTQRALPETLDAPGKAGSESGLICCDPMAAADALGNVWFGGLSFRRNASNPSRIVVNRMAAGGTTFQALTTGLPVRTSGTQDKPMMTIDNTPTSPTFGRLYVVWDEPTGGGINLVISQCDTRVAGSSQPGHCDNADNWSTPASVTPAAGSYIYADVAVGPDGRVYVTWWDYSNVNAIRGDVCDPAAQNCASATGWSAAPAVQTIAQLDATGGTPLPFACPILAQPGGRASTSPSVEVDHSGGSQNGRVWVTWSDLRPGSGTTRCAQDPSTGDGTPPLASHLTFDSYVASAPAGALPGGSGPSESVATRLLSDGETPTTSDDWFPWVAVDQTTGEAWADFYSTRGDATRHTTNFYARSVTPGAGSALTLGALTKVSTGASDYSGDPCCAFGNDYGDYTGIAATGGQAYPVWSDNSSGSGDGEAFAFVGSPSPDPPTVTTQAASGVGSSTATLNGIVNPKGLSTTYHFEYGTTTSYGSSTGESAPLSGTTDQPVSAPVSGLQPGTVYHCRLVAHSDAGTSAGNDVSFTTGPAPSAPAVATGSASGPTASGATLNGTVNPKGQETQWRFHYGTTTGYELGDTVDQSAGSGTSGVPVSASVSGLQPDTLYHFKLSATNTTGTTQGDDATFTTAPLPPPAQPPAVTTGAATEVSQAGAKLGGTVNPNGQATTYRFEYGVDTSYGQQAPDPAGDAGSASVPGAVQATVGGLSQNTTYHYRLVASNGTGTTAGDDATFQTSGPAPPPGQAPTATTGQPTGVTQTGANLVATVNPNGQDTHYRFDFGSTTQYGSQTQDVDVGAGTQAVAVAVALAGLTPGTTYHYRVRAENATGPTNGEDVAFTTPAPSGPGGAAGAGGAVQAGGGSPGGTPSGQTPAPTPPSFTVRFPAQRPAGVARRGLGLRANCGAPCRLVARLYASGAAARALGLARGSRVVRLGTRTGRRATRGVLSLSVPVASRARAGLRRARVITLTLRVQASSPAGGRVRVRTWRVTLRRTGRSPRVTVPAVAPASSAAWTGWAPAARLQGP